MGANGDKPSEGTILSAANLLEALDGLADAPANLWEILRAKDERGDPGDHDELRHPEAEQAAAPEAAAPPGSQPPLEGAGAVGGGNDEEGLG